MLIDQLTAITAISIAKTIFERVIPLKKNLLPVVKTSYDIKFFHHFHDKINMRKIHI